jgi:phosphonate transport system substrate-binding protein
MKRRLFAVVFAAVLILSLALTACQPAAAPAAPAEPAEPAEPVAEVEPTEVPPVEEAEPALGSAEKPIKVLFVPSVDANAIVTGGEVMAKALNQATGLNFEVVVPSSYAATIEEMCASPDDTMGFIPALGYVFASELCGVDVAFKAIRYGESVYWAQFIVRRDSGIDKFEDLAGKKWGYGDVGSTSGYQFPLTMLAEAGIEPGEKVETGGHPQSVKAVYNGEVDFATTFYTPPGKPEGEPAWKEGDAPDIPDDLVSTCKVEEKNIMCSGWEIRDARANIREEAPDVIQKVKILTITQGIPNDTLSFGPDFPADVRAQIETALLEYSTTEDWKNTIGTKDFYNWTGIDKAEDADYDIVRKMVKAVGVKLEDLGK